MRLASATAFVRLRVPSAIRGMAAGGETSTAGALARRASGRSASWISGYFAVILKSVTLDGWVVIGLLGVMALISWIVMVEKAASVSRLARANARFLPGFHHIASDLTVLDRGDADQASTLGGRVAAGDRRMMRDSSLYRIYHIGVEELRRRR